MERVAPPNSSGVLSPDRVPASARALEFAGFERTADVAGSLREQHRARRCELRGNGLRRRGHTTGRGAGRRDRLPAALAPLVQVRPLGTDRGV
ncbi:MAG TPA: hypothetical protein VF223_16030 [Trebonia sp.]